MQIKKQSPSLLYEAPLNIVGSSKFGRYPKISIEETWNMIISDDALVDYAGYKNVLPIGGSTSEGRGLFNSVRLGKMIAVVNDTVYTISTNLTATVVGTINSTTGDIFIDENDVQQIAICDRKNLYIFNWGANTFQKVKKSDPEFLDFIPGYVSFQDGYFLCPASGTSSWRLSHVGDGLSWEAIHAGITYEGRLQTKPDNVQCVVRMPGKGNLILVMGKTVTEAWTDVGLTFNFNLETQNLFPYQKSTYFNIDYGCLNPATVACSDKFIVWLGINEKSGPVILVSDGGPAQQLPPENNDGLNFKFANLKYPEDCYGFLFKQDGHLIYQFTFTRDNQSYAYDFNTQSLFNISDPNLNYHIAKKVVAFNNSYYFVSINDGDIYEFNSKYTTMDGEMIPRIRIGEHHVPLDTTPSGKNMLTFTMEQGIQNDQPNNPRYPDLTVEENRPCLDMSISVDGGYVFSSAVRKLLNKQGYKENRLRYWNLPRSNDFVYQLRFYSFDRVVAKNGLMSYYQ